MADLPWHPGDHAVTADGWRAVVIEVGADGVPVWFACLRGSRAWRVEGLADFVPDLADVGTAARWLRSCAEVVGPWDPQRAELHTKWAARLAIRAAHPSHAEDAPDPTLTARAVEATRAYRAMLETR